MKNVGKKVTCYWSLVMDWLLIINRGDFIEDNKPPITNDQ
jgi:hypothetical protein